MVEEAICFLEQTALGLRDFSKEARHGLPLLALALRVQSTQARSTSGFCVKLQGFGYLGTWTLRVVSFKEQGGSPLGGCYSLIWNLLAQAQGEVLSAATFQMKPRPG